MWSVVFTGLKTAGNIHWALELQVSRQHPERHARQAFFAPLSCSEENSEGAIPALWQTWQIQTGVRSALALGALRLCSQCRTWAVRVSLTRALQFHSEHNLPSITSASVMRWANKGEDPYSPQIHVSTWREGGEKFVVTSKKSQGGRVARASLTLGMLFRCHVWLRDPCNWPHWSIVKLCSSATTTAMWQKLNWIYKMPQVLQGRQHSSSTHLVLDSFGCKP